MSDTTPALATTPAPEATPAAATTHGMWDQAYNRPTTAKPTQQPAAEATPPAVAIIPAAEATPEAADNADYGQAEEMHPVIQETMDVFKAEGVTIEASDPEYKSLEKILKDPDGNIYIYRKELYKQIEAKRERMKNPAPAKEEKPAPTTTHGMWDQAYNRPAKAQPTQEAKPATTTHAMWGQAYKK